MTILRFHIIAFACLAVCMPGVAVAKDCNCKQHSAAASGAGSCSLLEDKVICNIRYFASPTNSEANALVSSLKSEIPIQETFTPYNSVDFQPTERQFRDLIVNLV